MSKRMIMAALMILCLTAAPNARAQEKQAGKKTVEDPIGYFLGISVGQQLRQSGFRDGDFGFDALLDGFKDGLSDNEVALSEEQLQATQTKITGMLQQRQMEMQKAQKLKGEQFLVENAGKDGVKTLEGGVQYKVLTAGEGASPAPTDTV